MAGKFELMAFVANIIFVASSPFLFCYQICESSGVVRPILLHHEIQCIRLPHRIKLLISKCMQPKRAVHFVCNAHKHDINTTNIEKALIVILDLCQRHDCLPYIHNQRPSIHVRAYATHKPDE